MKGRKVFFLLSAILVGITYYSCKPKNNTENIKTSSEDKVYGYEFYNNTLPVHHIDSFEFVSGTRRFPLKKGNVVYDLKDRPIYSEIEGTNLNYCFLVDDLVAPLSEAYEVEYGKAAYAAVFQVNKLYKAYMSKFTDHNNKKNIYESIKWPNDTTRGDFYFWIDEHYTPENWPNQIFFLMDSVGNVVTTEILAYSCPIPGHDSIVNSIYRSIGPFWEKKKTKPKYKYYMAVLTHVEIGPFPHHINLPWYKDRIYAIPDKKNRKYSGFYI